MPGGSIILYFGSMRTPLLILVAFAFNSVVYAYQDGDSTKKSKDWLTKNHYLDLSIGIGENVIINSFQWDKFFPILRNRVKIGFGFRMNMANYHDKPFYTAPPQQGPTHIRDTLHISRQTVYYFNLQFAFDIALLKWWDAGMNIDLVGASWGPTAEGKYYSSTFGSNGDIKDLESETFNAMLFGHNDFGNLNSQFFLRFWPSDNVYIKTGMGLSTFISHTTLPLNNGNTRFSAGSYTGFVSLGWTFGRSEWVPIGNGRPRLGTPGF
jgi:hypothetical protein